MAIRLEVGGRYINRAGYQVTIISSERQALAQVFLGNTGLWYYTTGTLFAGDGKNPNDLVALADDVVEKPARYMVMASQGSLPRKIHNTLEGAETEAKRLAALETKKHFSVIQIIKTYKAKIEVEEV